MIRPGSRPLPPSSLRPTPLPPWWAPRWLAFALSLWAVLAAAAVAATTTVPVTVEAVLGVFGALAVFHGWVYRSWWIAAPLAAVAVCGAGAGVLGLLPEGVETTFPGPAEPVIAAIWVAAFVIAGLDIAWALYMHARSRQASDDADERCARAIANRHDEARTDYRQALDDLRRGVTVIERLLTEEPDHEHPPTGRDPARMNDEQTLNRGEP